MKSKAEGAIFRHGSDEWSTPSDLFQDLDREFMFTLDVAASDSNYKLPKYYTKEDDALHRSWEGERVFCNPPYSEIAKWVEKCYREGTKDNTLVVCLIPARVDTKYFHDYIYNRAEIRFVRGRLHFEHEDGERMIANAPFPSMVVIFRGPKVWTKNP